MQCNTCGAETKVTNTKHVKTNLTTRVRKCLKCGANCTTHETPDRDPMEVRQDLEAAQQEREANRRHIETAMRKIHEAIRSLERLDEDFLV